MRELKFRIWSKEVKSFLHADDIAICNNGNVLIYDWHHNYHKSWGSSYDRHIIQQFTGLKDKNGKEIYEGDIVRFDEPTKLCQDVYMSSLYVFGFHNGSFLNPEIYNSINGRKFSKVEPNSLNPDGRAKLDSNPHFDWTRAEVLGNIYADSELIDL